MNNYNTKPVTTIYELIVCDYDYESFVDSRFFDKKDAYRRMLYLKYMATVDWREEQLLYGKDDSEPYTSVFYVSTQVVY